MPLQGHNVFRKRQPTKSSSPKPSPAATKGLFFLFYDLPEMQMRVGVILVAAAW